MTLFLSDTFDEASTTALASHTPSAGGAWVKHPSYTAGASVVGGGGYARGDSTTSTAVFYNDASPSSADYAVEATVQITSTTNPLIGVLARVSSSANTFYQLYLSAGTTWRIEKVIAGAGTSLAEWTANPSTNTEYTLRLEVEGSNLRGYVDGVLRLAVTDSSISDAGFAGLRARQVGRIYGITGGDLAATIQTHDTLVSDGCWTWFDNPRGVCYNGHTYVGSISSSGDVQVSKINNATLASETTVLSAGFSLDDHAAPSVLVLPDGRIVVGYCSNGDTVIRYKVSTSAEDISAFGSEQTISVPNSATTYVNLFWLDGPAKGIVFSRAHTSGGAGRTIFYRTTDDFLTWSSAVSVVTNASDRPYFVHCQDGDVLHFLLTDKHPNNGTTSTFHMRADWVSGALKFSKTDGAEITASQPFAPSEATQISSGASFNAWVWDITTDTSGYPRVLVSKLISATDHRYMFSRWDGSAWTSPVEICEAGARLYAAEPNYSGGICFDARDPNVVYPSRSNMAVQTAGWELEEHRTADDGASWSKHRSIAGPIVAGQRNCRPFSPRNHTGELAALWWFGGYASYASYNTAISGVSNDTYADSALAGDATSSATATGALTTAIPLAGASAAITTATGSLTTSIDLAGSAASVAVASGVLTAEIKLSGAALAAAAATAAFATSGAQLAGDAAALASAVGALTTQIRLSGAAVAQAIAEAGLTTGSGGLDGAAQASASASGLLTTQIPLVGEAVATAGASGSLGSPILLSGVAASASNATGDLTVRIALEGYSLAQAIGSGVLTAQIRLDGVAIALAAASGLLSGTEFVYSTARTLTIAAQSRDLTINAEDRMLAV